MIFEIALGYVIGRLLYNFIDNMLHYIVDALHDLEMKMEAKKQSEGSSRKKDGPYSKTDIGFKM